MKYPRAAEGVAEGVGVITVCPTSASRALSGWPSDGLRRLLWHHGGTMKRRSKVIGKPAKARRFGTSQPKRGLKPDKAFRSTADDEAGEIVRLNRELREALERQAATSQVLQVISSSAGELHGVFQTILANATRICEAKFGVMQLLEGDGLRAAAFPRRRCPIITGIVALCFSASVTNCVASVHAASQLKTINFCKKKP